MPTVIDHIIEGTVLDGDKIAFAKEKLSVQAFVKGQEVAGAEVDPSGRYKLSFTSAEERPTTELRVSSTAAADSDANLASAEILTPTQFVTRGNQSIAQHNLTLPSSKLVPAGGLGPLDRVLPMCGQVFAWITPHQFEGQLGLKLDFYSFEPSAELRIDQSVQPPLIRAVIVWRKLLSYTSYTGSDGVYAGCFSYKIPIIPPLRPVPDPYFMVEISQFFEGNWNKVYEEHISLPALRQYTHFDFLIPIDKLVGSPVCTTPKIGFLFGAIGLIPCDDAHIVKGYVSSQTGDQIMGLTHRPMRGVLRIFGLFAKDPQVASYKFEIAATDENHVPGPNATLKWEDLTDPLSNRKRDSLTAEVMGPDPITHVYKNIDGDEDNIWGERDLKFEWNSANRPDGFYALRIKALDKNNNPVMINNEPLVVEMPVLRIDNSLPTVKIEAVGAEESGKVVSTDGKLKFNITAYDPQGHVLDWNIRALAGRDAIELNADPTALQFDPPANTGSPGEGVPAGTMETLTIVKLPRNLAACDPLVYNFELIAHGSAITGYPSSECGVRDDVSLMVTKS